MMFPLARKFAVFLTVVLVCLSISGCDKPASESIKSMQQSSQEQPVDTDKVLAEVNSSLIYQSDLDEAIRRSLSSLSASDITDEIRVKVLDSLIGQRALALASEKLATPDDQATIERQTKAYREELFVKLYLQAHVEPMPVSADMVQDYYKKHPDEFAGETKVQFEYLATTREINEEERASLFKRLEKFSFKADWQQLAGEMSAAGMPVQYKTATMNVNLIEEPLRSLIKSVEPQQITPVKQQNGLFYIAKLVSREAGQIKALAEVSNEIRQKLAPVQMRGQVKKAIDEALSSSKVIKHQ